MKIKTYEQFITEGVFFNKRGDVIANKIIDKIEKEHIDIKKYGHGNQFEYYVNIDNKKCIFMDGLHHFMIYNKERLTISEYIINRIKELYENHLIPKNTNKSIGYPEMDMY